MPDSDNIRQSVSRKSSVNIRQEFDVSTQDFVNNSQDFDFGNTEEDSHNI